MKRAVARQIIGALSGSPEVHCAPPPPQELGLLAAIAGLLTSAAVLFHLVPTFLAMAAPRPRPAGREGEAPPASPSADHPPGYDTLMETTLPGYDDSMVEKPETAVDKPETDADKLESAPEVK